ncbi:general secretion pathway protein GspD [Mucilaginibacter kameinonensis]|uniref:general secretion pathway protein GspD n=1 Tax=Mucilaginibacter kameinonensis TaxID=452286 RepID=UPI001FC96524|nr:general secretion pathway protein GspD [Mucilaginibacter kameinonensis]
MGKRLLLFLFFVWAISSGFPAMGQETERIQGIHQKLDDLALRVPGLGQRVQLRVSGGSIREYLNTLARANNLNISVDPALTIVVYDNFNNATAANILMLMAQKYNLDVTIVGTIIYITPFQDPNRFVKPLVKDINAKYNTAGNALSLELQNDSLPAVAKKISQVSGKNVIVPGALQGKLVTAFIEGAPFEGALEKLAYTNELKMVKTADGFYLFQPLGENEELYINGDRNTSVRKNFRPSGPSQGGPAGLYVRMVNGQKLITADAVGAPINDLVKQASQETGKSYSIYSEIKGNITLHVTDVSYDTFLNLLFKSTEYTFHSEGGIYIIGDRKQEGLRSYKAIHLQNRAIDTVVMMIPADWKRGLELKEFREQNTLLVSGSDAQINEVEAFIKQLDVLVPSVLVEVTLIDIHKSRSVSTGITAGVSDSVKTGGTVLSGLDYTFGAKSINNFLSSLSKNSSINLGRVTPNFYISLKALEESNNVDVRSVPKLVALNGHTAKMSIGSKRYYKNTTQNVITTTATQSIFSNVYEAVNADLSIGIKPLVSGNDEVTLGISVNISDFTSIPTDGSPPPQSISKFETSLRVHSEDTIVLGGIERTESDESGSGIPILSRIPVLKWIFSSRTKSKSKVVSVLFIKSTIIR